ncbi:MAG: hypothetical protein IJ523_09715 [Succinivibrionaceae bacterium]|nr:hypothetical protein [Succinivibrionaceae bacterium]
MPKKSYKGKSTIGVKNLVFAPLTKDDETGYTYGDLVKAEGTIEVTITPQNTDLDVQYADDVEYDVIAQDPEIEVSVDMASLPVQLQAEIHGHEYKDGVMVEKAGDTPSYYAMGFKAEKTDGSYRFVWLLKCRAKPGTETYRTKEGRDITRQTNNATFTAIKRTFDGKVRAVADESDEDFTGSANFLDTVYGGSSSADSGEGE